MRFHMGVSFSWRTLKKFIIPILLGTLAYFGFSGIFDNFDIPLGFINVNALENYDTTFNMYYTDLNDTLDSKIDNNITFKEFFDYLNTLDSEYYNLIIFPTFSNTDVYHTDIMYLSLFMIKKSYSSLNYNFRGVSYYLRGQFNSLSSSYYKMFSFVNNSYDNIYNSTDYLAFLNCFQNNSCSNSSALVSANYFNYSTCSSSIINNDSSYVCYSPAYGNNNTYGIFYSSKVPLVYYPINTSQTNNFYKTLYINDIEIKSGDYFPTYLDYLDSLPTDDDNPPTEEEPNHKKLFSKIFWFDDSNTEKGILSSIYILLFLYCLTMILFKIATLLKNKRW